MTREQLEALATLAAAEGMVLTGHLTGLREDIVQTLATGRTMRTADLARAVRSRSVDVRRACDDMSDRGLVRVRYLGDHEAWEATPAAVTLASVRRSAHAA